MKAFFAKIWAWVLAHKVVAICIAAGTALVIATAVAVPVGVSSVKKKKAQQETQQPDNTPSGGDQGGQQQGGEQGGGNQGGGEQGSGQSAPTYTVVWKNDNGSVLETDTNVAEGSMPSFDGADPTKASTAQYDYAFNGWNPAVTAVTGDAEYTATFSSTLRKYTVQFLDEDGQTVLQSNQVNYGEMPTPPADPTKTQTAEFTYVFGGWDHALEEVHGNQTYVASYNSTKRSYYVHFVNYDGSALGDPLLVEYGQTPEYTGATPTKPTTETETFTFLAWDTTPGPVTGEVTYTATFSSAKTKYRYEFINDDDASLGSTQNVDYDVAPADAYAGEGPVSSQDSFNMNFTGWTQVGDRDTTNFVVTYKANYVSTGVSQDKWFTWADNGDDTYSVQAISEDYEADTLVIPSTHEGKPVTGILNDAAYYKHNLKHVVIPASVTQIGYDAFNSCTNLESVEIQGHPNIGNQAFRNCGKLTDVEVAGGGAYTLGTDVFTYSHVTNVILGEGLVSIPWRFVYGNTYLNSISLPASLVGVNGQAFYECTNLETVTFADGSVCEGIGNSSFYGCSNLTSITLPDSLISIDMSAFGRTGLTSIVIPDNVVSINSDAFGNCASLASVHIGKKVNSAYVKSSWSAFDGSPIEAFTVSAAHEELTAVDGVLYSNEGHMLFRYPAGKTGAFVASDQVTNIEIGAFMGCTGISSVDLSATTTGRIPANCFKNSSLTSVVLPDTVGFIFGEAFYNTPIEALTIPASVVAITGTSFDKCDNLTSITFEGTNFAFENDMIFNYGKTKLIDVLPHASGVINSLPATCTTIGEEAFMGCTNITSVVLPNTVTTLESSCFAAFVGSVTLSENITALPTSAFAGAEIGSIVIPNGVISMGAYVFEDTDITSIVIPNSCTSIGESLFSGCENLTTVNMGGINSIPSRTFYGCTALETLVWSNAVEWIGNDAFTGCAALENDDIILPASLDELWNQAFWDMSITEIEYEGTKADWEALEASSKISATWTNCITTVHCSDLDITISL